MMSAMHSTLSWSNLSIRLDGYSHGSRKLVLRSASPTLVSPAMYQACLRYTLVARIAPNWNKTGEWLIQGRDFLTSNGYVNAVKLDITVNQGEMYFSLDATTVKFLPLQVEDLDIYGKCYKEFMENHHAEIDECAIGSPWSHVLPSMKKGKVVGVTRTLPQNGPFKSYKDLKRHWKNTYGYRLPDSDDGVIYYQVHFRPLGGRIFTYPSFDTFLVHANIFPKRKFCRNVHTLK
ncbi:uncharacterized protein C18orf63-like [Pecten maximus]|uniref:uncharacterized protein C18orf63-like n=1 Tax=Pecten maximus TaxID=6579 RepID=UPI001458B908|nr:uncharacterized protein C18orf63-like [Pecten maximus]